MNNECSSFLITNIAKLMTFLTDKKDTLKHVKFCCGSNILWGLANEKKHL